MATGILVLSEVYLQMATGNEKPPFAIMLKSLPFLVRTMPLRS